MFKALPFKCSSPVVSDGQGSIAASFQLAEPYGTVRMDCERVADVTNVEFATYGNIRGRAMAAGMAKAIKRRIE